MKCTCASLKPGRTSWPFASIIRVLRPSSFLISSFVPTAMMRLPRIANASADDCSLTIVWTLALMIIKSAVGKDLSACVVKLVDISTGHKRSSKKRMLVFIVDRNNRDRVRTPPACSSLTAVSDWSTPEACVPIAIAVQKQAGVVYHRIINDDITRMARSEQQIEAYDELIEELQDIVGDENVLSEPEELLVYECDGLPQHKHAPRAVVFPSSTEETSQVLKALSSAGVSFAPRGAGTGLSGGALAVNRGFVIELARMRKILKIDPENRIAVVQTGLVNAQLSRAVSPYGLYYVPDPSSQPSCTIGGNIAENAGGIHCLKYGTTTDHVLATRVVLSGGSIVELDSRRPGYDLLGVFIGSEGTFGIATEATLRLLPIPPAIRTLLADFTDVDDASRAVSAIIAAGMLPAALEMMDNEIIRAVEASVFTAGLPIDAQAVLLVELDGLEAGIEDEAEKVEAILREHGARSVRRAAAESERKKLWAARKGSFGAVGRLSPDIMIQDAVVPRSRLPEILAETYRISERYKIKLANVFHAGDGNLHPLICFDLRRGDDL